jgi:hypothetical protein
MAAPEAGDSTGAFFQAAATRQRHKQQTHLRPFLSRWRKEPKNWPAITRPPFEISASRGPRSFLFPTPAAIRRAALVSRNRPGPLVPWVNTSAFMPDPATYVFRCPICKAEYKVVRVEASPTHDSQLTCLSCNGPLPNRVGKYALKYFRVTDGRELDR